MISDLAFLAGFALGIAVVTSPFAYYSALEARAAARSRRSKAIAAESDEQ